MTEPAATCDAALMGVATILEQFLGETRAWAFVVLDDAGPHLLASDRLDECGLREVMSLGVRHAMPTLNSSEEHPEHESVRSSLVLTFPRLVGPRQHALLYLETPPACLPLSPLLNLEAGALDAVLRARFGTGTAIFSPMVREQSAEAAAGAALWTLLERHEWNVSRVARDLGITRTAVYHRMRRYSIPRLKRQKTPVRRASRSAEPIV